MVILEKLEVKIQKRYGLLKIIQLDLINNIGNDYIPCEQSHFDLCSQSQIMLIIANEMLFNFETGSPVFRVERGIIHSHKATIFFNQT